MTTFTTTKLSFIFTFIITIGCWSNNVFAQIPTNGLIGFYPFNGNANDESVNTNHGTVSGASTITDRLGNTNQAYSFNGTSNYITLPNTYDFAPRTINIWFNAAVADYSDWRYVMTSDNPALQKGFSAILLREINGKMKMQLALSNVWDTIDVTLNVWNNVTLYAGMDSVVKYYLNGNLIAQSKLSSHTTSVNGLTKVIIGSNRTATSRFFKGHIDDIRIYNRELTPNEIERIYNEGKCIKYISVTDTLIINLNIVSADPLKYKNNIKVYPNPTSDQISIDCGNNFTTLQHHKIKISNALGQTVFSNTISQQIFTIDLSTWSGKGLYLMYILDAQDNIIDVKKIILN